MEVSRFSCMLFLGVRGVSDYAGLDAVLAFTAKPMLPSPVTVQVGVPIYLFEAQYPAHQCPCLRFDAPPRDDTPQNSGSGWFATPFL